MTDLADRSERVDPQAVVAEIKAEVARRRAAGEYPEALLRRLESELLPADTAPALEALAHLETVRPLSSTRAVAGRAAVFAKRTVRRAVAWYVRPITEDQTRFNFAAVRRIQELQERLAALEARVGRQEAPRADAPPAATSHRSGGG